jgi:hypothetical protein
LREAAEGDDSPADQVERSPIRAARRGKIAAAPFFAATAGFQSVARHFVVVSAPGRSQGRGRGEPSRMRGLDDNSAIDVASDVASP